MKPRGPSLLEVIRSLATRAAWVGLLAGPAHAADFPTPEAVLRTLFPGSQIRSESVFLTEEQKKTAETLAGEPLPTRLYKKYVVVPSAAAAKQSEPPAHAYLDSHRVRTSGQTLLIVLDPKVPADSPRVRRIEVTSFFEPQEYQPRSKWLAQFEGKALDEELRLKRAIQPITGATLTARAVTAASRRILAIHQATQARPPR